MNTNIRHWGGLFLLICVLSGALARGAEKPRTVRVSFFQYSNTHLISADGTRSGYGYDLMEQLRKIAGWEVVYSADNATWGTSLSDLRSGKLDIVDIVHDLPERHADFAFSAFPIGYSSSLVLARTDEKRFRKGDYTAWNGQRVGFVTNDRLITTFKNFAHDNFIDYQPVTFATEAAMLEALRDGKVSLAVIDSMQAPRDFLILEELAPRPYYLITRKNDTALMAEINNALKQLNEKKSLWISELQRRYYPRHQVHALIVTPRSDNPATWENYYQAFLQKIASVNGWQLAIEKCAEDALAARETRADIICGLSRNPHYRQLYDFTRHPAGQTDMRILARKDDARFADGLRGQQGSVRVACASMAARTAFAAFAAQNRYLFTAKTADDEQSGRAQLRQNDADLLVSAAPTTDKEFKAVAVCNRHPFYLATPKSHPEFRQALADAMEYLYIYEPETIDGLAEKYLHQSRPAGKRVRMAVYLEGGLVEINEQGVLEGYAVDYARRLAEHNGWALEFIPTNYSNGQEYLAEGVVDLLPGVVYTPENAKIFDYPRVDMGSLYYSLMVPASSPLRPNQPETWHDRTIAVLHGSEAVKDLEKFLNDRGVKYRLQYFREMLEAEQAVRDGKCDAVYTLLSRHSRDFEALAVLPTQETYLCTNRQKPWLGEETSRALSAICQSDPNYMNLLANKFFPGNRNIFVLDAQELAFVKQQRGKAVIVDIAPEIPPLKSYNSATRQVAGIVKHLFAEMAANTGLEFRLLPPGGASSGTVPNDSVIGANYGSTTPTAPGSIAINSGARIPLAFVRRKGDHLYDLRGKRIAIAAYDQQLQKIAREFSSQIQLYPDNQSLFDAVAEEKADAALTPAIFAKYWIDRLEQYPDLAYQPLNSQKYFVELQTTFPLQTDPRLRSIITKFMMTMDEDKLTHYYLQSLPEDERLLHHRKTLDLRRLLRVLSPLALGALALVMLLLAYYNRRLKGERDNALAARRAQQNADMQRLEQEAANKAKSAFLFNMSHDIRTPMNAITGFTAMALKHIDDTTRVRDCLGKIGIASGHLLNLINEVLDMSRIESGKVILAEDPADIIERANAVLTICNENAVKQGVQVLCNIRNVRNRNVLTDIIRLNQIIINIISNAIKYTKAGGTVTFTVEQLPDQKPGFGEYRFTVADTGIGMKPEFVEHIFDAFSREATSTVSKIEGTGLGMSIVKRLVDLLGGTVKVASTLGQGTTVTIELSLKQGTGAKAATSRTATRSFGDIAGRRILLVEDNDLNREIAKDILEENGLVVEEAEDGDIAVEKVKQAAPDYYDVIFMDVQMPRMNGYDATRAIRALPDKRFAEIPIIAMTANAFAEDRQHALDAGMNTHLAKPLDSKLLQKTLREYC